MLAGRYITFIICSLLIANTSFAVKQFRCNGKVQYRPCPPTAEIISARASLISERIAPPKVDAAVHSSNRDSYAQVLEQSFKRLNTHDGLWRGRIKGNGRVHLELQIYENGSFDSRRYMGNVVLVNKSTPFSFRSVAPKGKNWTWKILAFAS